MIELRCDRRLHAKLRGRVLEVHCRYCSGDRSTDTIEAVVYHRWKIVKWGLARIDDREDRLPKKPIESGD